MKREEVRQIVFGITDEQLDGVMKLHGGDITAYKEKIAALEGDVSQKNEKISYFEGIDIEGTKKAEYERGRAEAGAEFERKRLESSINGALELSGAKNITALKALLKLDDIKLDGEKLTGLDEQIAELKQSCGYLFNDLNQPHFALSTLGSGDMTKGQFDAMSYSDRLMLYRENPELYRELTKK